jgi:hypothetical protein
MIHFFPELAALYHRSLFVSANVQNQEVFFNEWCDEFWKFNPTQGRGYQHLSPQEAGGETIKGLIVTSLGKRKQDEQKLIGLCTNTMALTQKTEIVDLADSLFIEVDPQDSSSEQLFSLKDPTVFRDKPVVWCLKKELESNPNLHELALDKKMAEIAPHSLRILWPKQHFIHDALEWVLSF